MDKLSEIENSSKDSTHELHNYSYNTEINIPIVFNENYDISLLKLENIHPFDTKKWGKIASKLKKHFQIEYQKTIQFLSPSHPITNDELRLVHSDKFIDDIHNSKLTVIKAAEVPRLAFLPMFLIRSRLITPLKWQTAGSVLAGYVALKQGWAINIGGGFHHCCAKLPGGFCFFADIKLLIKYLWKEVNESMRFMIVDLDAHQGNGYERDVLLMDKSYQIYIFDMFNANIYPFDYLAMEGIRRKVRLASRTGDELYIDLVRNHLREALDEFPTDFIVYNAGTDILIGDSLGCLNITPEGIAERDEIVFSKAKSRNIPIVMLTSGGYQRNNAQVIADSIVNLFRENIISL